MSEDPISTTMFWAGALMVLTPLIAAATVVAFLWYQRKKAGAQREEDGQGRAPESPRPGPAPQ